MRKMSPMLHVILIITICIEITTGNNVFSLPLEYQSNADKVLLYGKVSTIKCCGTKIAFQNSVAVLNLKECTDYITCEGEDWMKSIVKTTCSEIQMSHGCGTLTPSDPKDASSQFSIRCICSTMGLMCPNGLNTTYSCKDLQSSIITEEDEVLYISNNNNNKLKGLVDLREVFLPVYPVKANNNIRIKSSLDGNSIKVDISNAKNTLCTVFSEEELCNHYCRDISCSFNCDTISNSPNMHITVSCGNVTSTFWLFRERVITHGVLESHAHWRSHSKTLGTLLLIDISFGLLFFEIIVLAFYFMYRIVHYLCNDLFCNTFSNFLMPKKESSCLWCNSNFINIYDGLLHEEYCPDSFCPYCKDSILMNFQDHVSFCSMKSKALDVARKTHEKTVNEVLKEAAFDTRNRLRVLMTLGLSFKLWAASVLILTILTLISPSSATLINKPCNKLIGMTSDCKIRSSDQILKSSLEDHNGWSSVELGMINDLERVQKRGTFSFNALHRLKTQNIMKGDSGSSITLNVASCTSGESCKGFGDIEISGNVFPGFIQSYRTKNEGKLETNFNVFIPDAEVIVNLNFLYNTAEWTIHKEQHFDCIEKDCSKVCKEPESDKCPKIVRSRSADTSWKHNPYWCLTISSGCTCMSGRIIPKDGSDVYSVYSVGQMHMKALLCIEQNNIFIDCVTIDRKGEKNFHYGKLVIRTWEPSVKLPEKIIVKNIHGGNNTYRNALYMNACEKDACQAGDVGDFQFGRFDDNCTEGVYFSTNGFQEDIIYSFATTPTWEVIGPQPGILHISEAKRVSETPAMMTHTVNVEKNQLIIKGDIIGFVNARITVNNIELFSVNEKGVISDFAVKNCQGYYMSEIGSICTFQVKLSRSKRSVISVTSNDDSNYVQSDSQVITEGLNTFRKFMYTRSKQPSYSFCANYKDLKICNSIKYNLTDPTQNWKMLPQNSALVKNRDTIDNCNIWFGIFCMFSRFVDILKTLYSGIFIIIGGLLLLLLVWLIKKFYGVFLWNDPRISLRSKDKESLKSRVRRLRYNITSRV